MFCVPFFQSTEQSFYIIGELLGQPCTDLGQSSENCGDFISIDDSLYVLKYPMHYEHPARGAKRGKPKSS